MKKILWLGLILCVSVISACGDSVSSNANVSSDAMPVEYIGLINPLDESAIENGAVTFKSTCASCHGDSGYGNGVASSSLNPPPKNLAELQTQVGDDYLYWKISDGSLGTAMIGWKGILTEEQIWELITYIRTLK